MFVFIFQNIAQSMIPSKLFRVELFLPLLVTKTVKDSFPLQNITVLSKQYEY